jgi:hypothetical protein
MFRSVLCETTTQSQTEDRKYIEYKFVSKFGLLNIIMYLLYGYY